MSKLMLIVGILFAAVGVALGLMIFLNPGAVVGWGMTPEVAVTFLVGGALSVGLGGVIQALDAVTTAPAAAVTEVPPQARTETPIPEFGRKPPATGVPEISPAVQETITALEQAKTDIRQALGEEQQAEKPEPAPAVAEAPAETVPLEVAAAEDEPHATAGIPSPEVEEGQLFVVEERIIRDRPARLLSDGTVEAETEEGWMRFENLEHLDEYLDATAPAGRA